jgi:drug/metabolite transporter (DMT)-like permease
MLAILIAFISYVTWGVGDVFGTLSTRRLGSYSTTFWSSVIWLLLYLPFYPFLLSDLQKITYPTVLIIIMLNIFNVIALSSFYEGLRIGPVSLVGTIGATFAALVVVFSIIFLKESVNLSQIFSMLIIFFGLILSTLDFKILKKGKIISSKGVAMALIAMFIWGIYFTVIKLPIREIGWFWANSLSCVFFPLLYLYMRIRKIKLNGPNLNRGLLPLLGSAIFIAVGGTTFSYALGEGLSSVVAPIAGSYPTLFALLTFIFFKDKMNKQQIAGLVTTLFGIVLLAFFSV